MPTPWANPHRRDSPRRNTNNFEKPSVKLSHISPESEEGRILQWVPPQGNNSPTGHVSSVKSGEESSVDGSEAPMWSCFFFSVGWNFLGKILGKWGNGIKNKRGDDGDDNGAWGKGSESDKDGVFGEKQLWELKDTGKSERDRRKKVKLHIFGVKLNFDMWRGVELEILIRARGQSIGRDFVVILGSCRVESCDWCLALIASIDHRVHYCFLSLKNSVIRLVSLVEHSRILNSTLTKICGYLNECAEGKVAFRHSNIGLEPESQSFVFIDEDQISDGYKVQNQKVKEYENGVPAFLDNTEQGLNSSQYDMELVDCAKNEYDAKVRGLVEPVSHSSKDIESFMKFPNDIESVKRPPTSPISNPGVGEDSLRNSVDVYMVKTVTECEPHPEVRYNESNYHVVKDICVDEGVLKKDNVLFVNPFDEKVHNFFPLEGYETKEKEKDNTSINVLSRTPTEESHKVSANHNQHKDLILTDDDATEKVSGDVKEMPSLGDKVLLQDLLAEDSVSSDDKGEQISNEPGLQSLLEESKNTVEEAILASASSALADDESKNDSKPAENASLPHQFDPSASANCGKEECRQAGGCKCDEIQHTSRPIEWKSDDQAATSHSHIRHSLGESSFSAIGPMSGRISYSGPVPYSGSISLRSDSSTTSTRSFAFPIIQSEWNSSPVRMAKADRRLHRKQRCWRVGFLCCKF
ncbi:unnamed protein product [Sphenostylis stenocarpa]|uniref:Uncharacterized protein n=1 Tax=Sphenostylis stenocarpa TaxID=92480 RepID=A0AA86SJZ8_9FABA|nr:unnamed protein product [Sphenostylis stenocarpa]